MEKRTQQILKKLVREIIKESFLNKSDLEGQPKLTIPVTLHLNPKQTTFSSAQAVATLKDKDHVYDLVRGGANELAGEMVELFAKDINDVRDLEMSKSDLKAYLFGMIESLKRATDPEDIKFDIENIKKTLRDNLYTVPPELEKANDVAAVISQLEEMAKTLRF